MEHKNEEFDKRLRNRISKEEHTAPEQGDWEHMEYLLDVLDSASPAQKSIMHIGLFSAVLKWSAVILLTLLPLSQIEIEYATEYSKRNEQQAVIDKEAYSNDLRSGIVIPNDRNSSQGRSDASRLYKVNKQRALTMRSTKSDLTSTKEYQQAPAQSNLESDVIGILQHHQDYENSFSRSYLDESAKKRHTADLSSIEALNNPLDTTKQNNSVIVAVKTGEKDSTPVTLIPDTTNVSVNGIKRQPITSHHWGVTAGAGFAFKMPKPSIQFILEASYRYNRPSWYLEHSVGIEQHSAEHIVSDYTQDYYFLRRETRKIQLEVRSTTYLTMRTHIGYQHARFRYYAGPVAGYLLQSKSSMSQFNSKGERQVLEQHANGYIDGLNVLTVGLAAGVEHSIKSRMSIGVRVHYYQRYHAIMSNGALNDFQGYIRYSLK